MNNIQKSNKDKRIFEISQSDFRCEPQGANPNGRRSLKLVLHEIYPDTSFHNLNGITYLEKYVRMNADTVKGMPLCAQFLDDDRKTPYGHGMTGRINNMPVFEDSFQVGSFDDWSIEDLEIKGKMRKCLCATGYVNEARYPKFTKWMFDRIEKGEEICGSVEFVGTKNNDGEIIYDGGWKEKGRIPMVYDYSGYCILSITPSDPAAILVELNENKNKYKEVSTMVEMSEEVKALIGSVRDEILTAKEANAVTELNGKIESLNTSIGELNKQLEAKTLELEQCREENERLKKQIEENDSVRVERERELNSKIEQANADKEEVCKELNELKKANRVNELNSALAEYTEEQKGYAKEEIEAFKADPFNVEINSITDKIDAVSYQKIREAEKARKNAELNNKSEFDDIIANIDPIVNDEKKVEDFDVFA